MYVYINLVELTSHGAVNISGFTTGPIYRSMKEIDAFQINKIIVND